MLLRLGRSWHRVKEKLNQPWIAFALYRYHCISHLPSVNATRNFQQPYMICKTAQTIIYYYYTQTIVIDFKTYMSCDIQKGPGCFSSIAFENIFYLLNYKIFCRFVAYSCIKVSASFLLNILIKVYKSIRIVYVRCMYVRVECVLALLEDTVRAGGQYKRPGQVI